MIEMTEKELNQIIDLCKTEQALRVKLQQYKELTEFVLQQAKELKPLAENLNHHKNIIKLKGIMQDKELDKQIKKIINNKFLGGVLNG